MITHTSKIFFLMILIISTGLKCSLGSEDRKFLNPLEDRPPELTQKILTNFYKVEKREEAWRHNGPNSGLYNIVNINELKLLLKMIKDNPEQEDFYVLDIGAGYFQWVQYLQEKLSEESIRSKVHIFGIIGEKYKLPHSQNNNPQYKTYEYGNFKIEMMDTEFANLGHDVRNKFDLIVSRWTFCHLVDPVGTFVQAYNLLRPQTGVMLFDEFHFLYKDQDIVGNDERVLSLGMEEQTTRNMLRLLKKTNAPFLIHLTDQQCTLNSYMIKRSDHQVCPLPLTYKDSIFNDGFQEWPIYSGFITRFHELEETMPLSNTCSVFPLLEGPEYHKRDCGNLYGNRELFEWIVPYCRYKGEFLGEIS